MLSFKSINLKLWKELLQFEPFGRGNPRPVFLSRNVKIKKKDIYDKCARFGLTDQQNILMNAVFWFTSMYHVFEKFFGLVQGQLIDVAYELELNTWDGYSAFQLNLKDFENSR